MICWFYRFAVAAALFATPALALRAQPAVTDAGWPCYARTPEGTRYSPLDRIDAHNASRLTRAWTVHTGEIADMGRHYWECTPLMVNDTLYVMTLYNRVLALDPVTGDRKWEYDPGFDRNQAQAIRGISYWEDGGEKRIILPRRDAKMVSLDADTGEIDESFGDGGVVDLRKRLCEDDGHYLFLSSPPVIYKNLVITGFGMADAAHFWMPQVPIVALDVRTGETVWTFNTVPQEGEAFHESWAGDSWFNRGAANCWSIMSLDPERGLLYIPTGAVQFDFYGGDRAGDNLFANCVIALNAATGKYVWHFQTVHHDVWDYDIPAQPNLVDLTVDGKTIPAVAQVSKTGFVYVLNRVTGEPLFPVDERPVPNSDVPGETVSPTQPFPSKPPAFSKQGFSEDDLNDLFPEERDDLLKRFHALRAEGPFTPPSFHGSLNLPGFHGGANWSGAAVSPDGMLYVNTTELAGIVKLVPAREGRFRYNHTGWIRFRDSKGYPANKPPWGKLVKIDLNRGEIVWQKPLGEFDELTRRGIPVTGQENFGGATVTAGGVVLIASTKDERFRVFDAATGEIVFTDKLPAAGYAAPITYLGADGRQYVTICAGGGGKIETPQGDCIVTYVLE
ncbi:MAG: PQQ-binding-like beta-propeller repeat protein [bacterium]|nr:PQQ-binding-like beta-propeller repeat protein [bacterium]